jgi:hypothetical protein
MSVGFWLMGITTGVKSMITSVSCKFLTDESQSAASRRRLAKLFLLCSLMERALALEGGNGALESMSLLCSEMLFITKEKRSTVYLTFYRHRWMSMQERGTTERIPGEVPPNVFEVNMRS